MRTGQSIACVFAHPDDETFATAGTLARYADAGVRWDLYCATDGDAGKSSGIPVASRAELGLMRRRELQAAAGILGARELEFGGHADRSLGTMDAELLIGEIVRFLRRVRPAIVITFGPEGAPTGHPDHRAISRAATAAFFLAGVETEFHAQISTEELEPWTAQRLYYVAWEGEQQPPGKRARRSLSPTAAIDVAAYRERKIEAFLSHATQRQHRAGFESTLTDREYYAIGAGVAQPSSMIEDLFEGLSA